jgi:hypothetical protein
MADRKTNQGPSSTNEQYLAYLFSDEARADHVRVLVDHLRRCEKEEEESMFAEVYRQGQSDREQGWPNLSDLWGFTGLATVMYLHGYLNPRTGPTT